MLAVNEVEQDVAIYRHYPVLLHIELTNRCNCECIMCTHSYTKNDGATFCDISDLEKYFPTCRLIVINGIGEPFLHPDIKNILQKFKDYQIKVSTTTNLSYLPDDLLPYIPKVFHRLSISCDGASPETFESIRRYGKFSKFVENVKRVREICGDTILHMAVTTMRQNLLEAPDIVKLAYEIGFDEVRFGRLETNPFLKNEKDALIHYPNLAAKVLCEAVEIGEKCGLKVVIPIVFQGPYNESEAEKEKARMLLSEFYYDDRYYEELNRQYMKLKKDRVFEHFAYQPKGEVHCTGICHWLAFGSNINIKGQIRPCGEIIREISENTDSPVDGNIMNTNEQINLRRIFINGFLPDVCTNCSYMMCNEFDWFHVEIDEYNEYFGIKR